MYVLHLTGTVRIWQANTYRLESTLNYGLERVWSMAMFKGSNNVALGYDEGSILIKVCQLHDFVYMYHATLSAFVLLWISCFVSACILMLIEFVTYPFTSLVGKSQPCLWIPMVKLFLPSTVKFNRPTLKICLVSVNILIIICAFICLNESH